MPKYQRRPHQPETDADSFPPKGTDEAKLLEISEEIESGKFFDNKNDPAVKGGGFLVDAIANAPTAIAAFTSKGLGDEDGYN